MSDVWLGGKGSKPRPFSDRQQYNENYDRIFNKSNENFYIKSFNIEIHQLYDLIETTGFIYDSIKGLLRDSVSGLLIARKLENSNSNIFVFDVSKLCEAFDAKFEKEPFEKYCDDEVLSGCIMKDKLLLFYIYNATENHNHIDIDNISKLRNYKKGKII